jgi:hypothetical protein
VLERAKTFHASDRAATVLGKIIQYTLYFSGILLFVGNILAGCNLNATSKDCRPPAKESLNFLRPYNDGLALNIPSVYRNPRE